MLTIKKVLRKGSLSCFHSDKMKFWIYNPFRYELCTVFSVPDNKFKRMKYYNERLWLKGFK